MGNFILNFSGDSLDEFIGTVNNIRPFILVSGLDANTEVVCILSNSEYSIVGTTNSSGAYTFYLNSYGTYIISGTKSNNSVSSENIIIDTVKRYSYEFTSNNSVSISPTINVSGLDGATQITFKLSGSSSVIIDTTSSSGTYTINAATYGTYVITGFKTFAMNDGNEQHLVRMSITVDSNEQYSAVFNSISYIID